MTSKIIKLTDDEIWKASIGWFHMDDTSYLDSFLHSDKLRDYLDVLKNHDVIEIGPGDNPVNNHFQCKTYSAANGRYPNDGLSVLRKSKDASAVVVSFGVFDYCILMARHDKEELGLRYIKELVEEIKRVANPFALIFGCEAGEYMGTPDIPISEDLKYGGVYRRK